MHNTVTGISFWHKASCIVLAVSLYTLVIHSCLMFNLCLVLALSESYFRGGFL